MDRVEEPTASSPGGESRARTPAYASFSSNIDKLKHILSFLLRGALDFYEELDTKIAPEIERLFRPQDSKEARDQETDRGAHDVEQDLPDQGKSPEMPGRVQRISDILLEPLKQFTSGLATIRNWIPVLMVTTVEAYLKDVRIYQAKVDPAIMESSGQSASYAEVVRAQSIGELTEELQSRWARKFVDDGSPNCWIKRLTGMGARGYRPEAASQMETLWGVRHLIVHSAGVATPEFVRRHPEIGLKVGESILIRSDQIIAWADVIDHFVDVTDFYFVQRYGQGTGSTT
jgi:hypothetical protein